MPDLSSSGSRRAEPREHWARHVRALGIPLKRGRLFAEGDAPGRPFVAVINETAARLYWSGDDPIGRTIRYYPPETNPSIQIVGIVGDIRSMGANEPAPPAVYVPLDQAPRPPYEGRMMTFIVRVPGNPAAIAPSARAAVASIDICRRGARHASIPWSRCARTAPHPKSPTRWLDPC